MKTFKNGNSKIEWAKYKNERKWVGILYIFLSDLICYYWAFFIFLPAGAKKVNLKVNEWILLYTMEYNRCTYS